MHRFTQTVFHFALMANLGHVDEVDDNQATQVAQTQLTGNFVGRFQVGLQRSLFDIAALGGAGGLISMEVRASVGSMTILPPEGRRTFTLEGRFDLGSRSGSG